MLSVLERNAMPGYRLSTKTTPDKAKDDAESRHFWDGLADDMDKHQKQAKKLAEVVRDIVITKKVAGRTVPSKTEYVRTVTKKSPTPIRGKD